MGILVSFCMSMIFSYRVFYCSKNLKIETAINKSIEFIDKYVKNLERSCYALIIVVILLFSLIFWVVSFSNIFPWYVSNIFCFLIGFITFRI